jgi:hypothetical protein
VSLTKVGKSCLSRCWVDRGGEGGRQLVCGKPVNHEGACLEIRGKRGSGGEVGEVGNTKSTEVER